MPTSISVHRAILLLLIVVFLFDRVSGLVNFNWKYTDHDQCTLWNAAYEAAQLKFHEPCFYGQNYNTNLEAYFAVPFLWCGMHCSKALPLATFTMFALIFILSAIAFFRQRNFPGSYFLMIVPVIMPDSFQLVTSLPRGFITGVFVVALGYYFCMRFPERKILLWFLFASLGFWVNPNSVMFSAPMTLLLFEWEMWMRNWKHIVFGVTLGSVYKIVVVAFYATHPTFVYHVKPSYLYDWHLMKEGLLHMDKFFFFFSWFFWLVFALSAFVFIMKRMKTGLLVCFFFVLMIILTMGFQRVHEELPTIFFHGGRMYIGAILTFIFIGAMALNAWSKDWPPIKNVWLGIIFCGIAILATTLRYQRIEGYVDEVVNYHDKGVIVSSIHDLEERNNRIISTCSEFDVDLVVYNKQCVECFMDCYTLPIYSQGKVESLNLIHDRRNWRFVEEHALTSRKFMLYLPDSRVENVDGFVIANGNFPYVDYQILNIDTNMVDFFASRMTGIRKVK